MAGNGQAQVRRSQIDVAIADGDITGAAAGLAAMWRSEPGPATANFVNNRIAALDPDPRVAALTVAILRSFTVEPATPLLRAAAAVNGIALTVHVGDFNAYAQELLDPSSPVYTEWAPDAVILAVDGRDVAPELYDRFGDVDAAALPTVIDRVTGELDSLVRTFRGRSQAHLVVHGLEVPSRRALGVADEREGIGQRSAVRTINEHLSAVCRSLPGVYLLDFDGVVSECGRRAWFDEDKWAAIHMPIRAEHLHRLANEWMRYLQPMSGVLAKAILVDLDNTLWGGVLGEDGPEGIAIGTGHPGSSFRAVQQALLDARARGLLLVICSKNNHDDVIDVLQSHPEMLLRPEHFVAIRANWDDKVSNIRSIANELNIGLDSIAFLDDSPVECAHVRQQLPAVFVLELDGEPRGYADMVRQNPIFERLSLSSDDRGRSTQYAQRRAAQELEANAASLEDFLRTLQTAVDVAAASDQSIARVAQLTQKTNQFNLTTRRYSEQQIAERAASAGWRVYTAKVTDRFGDQGLVGVVLAAVHDEVWEIDTFLLSCRVIGRSVETAILAAVAGDAAASGAQVLAGTFVPTTKNAPARDFFKSHGFECTADVPDGSAWTLELTPGAVSVPDWITLGRGED